MAFLTGRQGFWTLDLEVSPATLIPRPDSETLITVALAARPERDTVRRILDLGTGTGCLLLAALTEYPAAFGVGVDRAPEAAGLAARNAQANHLAGRCAMLCADWAAPLVGRFDLVLSNPPCIESDAIAGLLPGVLAPGGVAVLELGAGQAAAVVALARLAGFRQPVLHDDLAGIARAVVLFRAQDRKN
jgi:release factor glutamine methyltransferase